MKLISVCFGFVLFLSTSCMLQAQDFGLRAGILASDASIDFSQADIETEGATNFVAGVYVDIPIGVGSFSVQPELNFMGRAYTYEISSFDLSYEYTASYFDIGALLKYNFNRTGPFGFYAGVGPYLNYALKAQVVENGDERDVDFDVDGIRRQEITIGTALGVIFGSNMKFFGEFRYISSLTDQTEDKDYDLKQRGVMLTAGVVF